MPAPWDFSTLSERIVELLRQAAPSSMTASSIRSALSQAGHLARMEDAGVDEVMQVAQVLDTLYLAGRVERVGQIGGGYRLPLASGQVTDAVVYHRELSAAEVSEVHRSGPRDFSTPLEDRITRIFEVLMPHGTLSFGTLHLHLQTSGWEGQPGDVATAIGRLVEAGQLIEDAQSGGWRLPQPAGEEPTGPRPPQAFAIRVHRALAGQGWVPLDDLYSRMLVEGWEPPEIREGLSLEQTRRRLLGFQVRRLSTVETEGMYPNVRFRLRPSQGAAEGLSSEADLALPSGLENAIVRLLGGYGRGLTALEIANHLSGEECLRAAFAYNSSQDVANGPVLNILLASPRIVGVQRQGEMHWRLSGIVPVLPGYVERLVQIVWGSQGSVQLYSSDMYRIVANSAEMSHLSYDQFEDILVEGVRLRRIAQEWSNGTMLYRPWPSQAPRLSDHIHDLFPGVSDEDITRAVTRESGEQPRLPQPPQVIPLVDRVIGLFGNDLSRAYSFDAIQNGSGFPQHSELRVVLADLIRQGRLYFLQDQHSAGYRLVRREGSGGIPPTAWDRLKKDDPES